MSVSPHPRPAHPILRQAACSTIGLGCLLLAGTVLSSVVQPPPRQRDVGNGAEPFVEQPVCGLPVAHGAAGADAQPLIALVRLHHSFLRITNSSPRPWLNVSVLNVNSPSPQAVLCPLILPHQACDVPLPRAIPDRRSRLYDHYAFCFTWECRTEHGRGKWCGYLVR